jgi:hypothetical protein
VPVSVVLGLLLRINHLIASLLKHRQHLRKGGSIVWIGLPCA